MAGVASSERRWSVSRRPDGQLTLSLALAGAPLGTCRSRRLCVRVRPSDCVCMCVCAAAGLPAAAPPPRGAAGLAAAARVGRPSTTATGGKAQAASPAAGVPVTGGPLRVAFQGLIWVDYTATICAVWLVIS